MDNTLNIKMFEFYIFLGMVVIVIFAALIIYWFVNSGEFPNIKYKDFLKYYKLNPDRWYCGDSYVRYELFDGGSEYFCFGLISFYRYKLRNYRIAKAKQRKEYAKSMQRFLDDINKTETKND